MGSEAGESEVRGVPLSRRISAQQAADRLGIKVETLYAYVSRGMLKSERESGGGRASRFDASEVERLARGRRGRTRAGGIEVALSSGLTLIEDDRVCYRGFETGRLARTCTFESVTELLWGSEVSVTSDVADPDLSDNTGSDTNEVVTSAAPLPPPMPS